MIQISKKLTNWRSDIEKKWDRITASKSTIYFLLVSIFQALILIILQCRMLERNGNDLIEMINAYKANETDESIQNCFNKEFLPLYVLTLENLMFIFFYLFQMYFCFNAIFHEHTIQIITIAAINFGFICIGFMQLSEVKDINIGLVKDCSELMFRPKYIASEVFFIVVFTLLATLMGFLSLKLYRQFGWSIYKKIGGDVKMQQLYKVRLIFVMLLKLDLLIMVLFAGLLIPVFYILYGEREISEKILMFTSTVIMILVFFFEILAYKSLETEWETGMLIFIIFWIVALLNFAGLCVLVINLSVESKWYIGFVIGAICFSFALGTLVLSVLAYKNFGRGLKQCLEDYSNNKQEDTKVLIEKKKTVIDD